VGKDVAQTMNTFVESFGYFAGRVNVYGGVWCTAESGHIVEQPIVPVGANAHECKGYLVFGGAFGCLEAAIFVTVGLSVGKKDQVADILVSLPTSHLFQA